jgi:hypothetical protein
VWTVKLLGVGGMKCTQWHSGAQRNVLPLNTVSTNDLKASMTDKWNMSMEYFWNNSERVKTNFLRQEVVPESHYPPHTPYRVPWLSRIEAGGITLELCRIHMHIFLIQKQHGPSNTPHCFCVGHMSHVRK